MLKLMSTENSPVCFVIFGHANLGCRLNSIMQKGEFERSKWYPLSLSSSRMTLTLKINYSYFHFAFLELPPSKTKKILVVFRKYGLTFQANRLLCRHFVWNVNSYFFEVNKKNISNCRLLNILPSIFALINVNTWNPASPCRPVSPASPWGPCKNQYSHLIYTCQSNIVIYYIPSNEI